MASAMDQVPKGGATLAVVGCGTMGTAILRGIIDPGLATDEVSPTPKIKKFIATVNSLSSRDALREKFSIYEKDLDVYQGHNVTAMREADIVLLAFKPYMIDLVLRAEGVREALAGKLIISVLVGSPVEKIEAAVYYNGARRNGEQRFYVKRAMPNVGAEFGQSMTVIETAEGSAWHAEITDWLFSQIGKIMAVPPELFDVGGVLAGASGALLSIAFDGILDGAVSQGLKRGDAKKILTQALFSLATLLENGEHPAVLRESISSPRGTTIAGLLSLEENRARHAFSTATIASTERSKQIAKQK